MLLNIDPKRFVTLESPAIVDEATGQAIRFPVPDPKLLALHAACAKVIHLSGAAEYIYRFERDMKEMRVLATGGGSAGLLHTALRCLPAAISAESFLKRSDGHEEI